MREGSRLAGIDGDRVFVLAHIPAAPFDWDVFYDGLKRAVRQRCLQYGLMPLDEFGCEGQPEQWPSDRRLKVWVRYTGDSEWREAIGTNIARTEIEMELAKYEAAG